MATDPAVLVPRDVGDSLGDTDGLEQRLDAVVRTLAPELVADAGDLRQVEEAGVFGDGAGAVGLAVETLHAHEARLAVGGAGPPRSAVAFGVGGYRAVHVGGDG